MKHEELIAKMTLEEKAELADQYAQAQNRLMMLACRNTTSPVCFVLTVPADCVSNAPPPTTWD